MRRPYPSYRNSGVEWLGDLPEHWEVRRLQHICQFAYGDSLPSDTRQPGEVPVFGSNGAVGYHDEPNTLAPVIVIGRKGSHGQVNFHDGSAFAIDTTYFVDERYTSADLRWLFFALPCTELADESLDSAVPGLSREHAYGKYLAVPPRAEQQAIAAFLDRETAEIDTLVAKKRLLLERLAEYRTALIAHTVTKGLPPEAAREAGLNPKPPLKPSGVEWFGDVPEHWEVKRLEHVASYRTSSVDKKIEDEELAVRLCNYTDVYYLDQIRASDGNFMQATASRNEISRFKLKVGDVLITKDSEDWTDIAVPALVEETADDFVCGYHLGIIRPSAQADPAFIYRTMQSEAVNRQLQVASSGVTRYGLPNSAVGEVLIPLPPLNEQRAIAAFLNHRTERISALSSRVEVAIERLLEYRTALITAAVTGKVDVREYERVETGASRT